MTLSCVYILTYFILFMHDQGGNWVEGIDYRVYAEKNEKGKIGECNHCGKTFRNEKSLKYEHKMHCPLRYQDEGKKKQNSITIYVNEKQKKLAEEKIKRVVKYICETATPIHATQSEYFRQLTNSNYSQQKIREEIINYANELKEETKKQIRNTLVSLVIDGATINSENGWYALGLATRHNVYYYDVYHLSSSTTRAISRQLIDIINEIEKDTHARVIGACSDNAPNIAHVFEPDHPDGLAQLYGKYLLRVPCQAHTTNLVNATYARENPAYDRLRSRIKAFCTKASNNSIHELLGIKQSCPLIRDQRWFTEYDALKWIIENRARIEQSFGVIAELMEMATCPITNDWSLLLEALTPLRKFTTKVEVNVQTLGRSYDDFKEMKSEIERLAVTNKFARDLLEIVKRRWTSTSDENLLRLANFLNPRAYIDWREEFEEICMKNACSTASVKERERLMVMNAELENMIDTIIQYGHHCNFHFEDKVEAISFVLTTAKLPHSRVYEYYWEGLEVSSGQMEFYAHEIDKESVVDASTCSDICRFFCWVRSLPSSEAFCERIFSNMRMLFPPARASVHDDLIKAQTLIRITLSLNKP